MDRAATRIGKAMLVVLGACSTPRAHEPATTIPNAPPAAIGATPVPCCVPAPHPQPPEVALRLGHYANPRRGIGVIIDRTREPTRIAFDGTDRVIELDPRPGPGRIDYLRRLDDVVLQIWNDGRVVVFVAGDPIAVARDGDADPL